MKHIPYSGTHVQWNNDGKSFCFTLPWVSLAIEVDPQEKSWIEEAIHNLDSNYQHPSAQKFLERLQAYNICYTAPRSLSQVNVQEVDAIKGKDHALSLESPKTLVKSLTPDIYNEIADLLPEAWEWPLSEVLSAAQIPNTTAYDPITVVTYLIGKRLENESQSEHLRNNLPQELEALRQKDEGQFFKIMAILLAQTYYVTSHFEKSIRASLQSFPEIEAIIKEFMRQEKGHDRLMINSLKELGYEDPSRLKSFASTQLPMELLKWSSEHSSLALTLMVGHFEGSGYEETDFFADILEKSSKPKAAKGYAIHHDINKGEQHCDVILDLAKCLNLQPEASVIYAMRILELATTLGTIGDGLIMNAIQKGGKYEN